MNQLFRTINHNHLGQSKLKVYLSRTINFKPSNRSLTMIESNMKRIDWIARGKGNNTKLNLIFFTQILKLVVALNHSRVPTHDTYVKMYKPKSYNNY